MGKFVTRATNSSANVLRDRAIIIEQTLATEQKKLINSYDAEIQKVNLAINKLTDVAPDESTSLRVGGAIDPAKWVNDLQHHKLKLRDLLIARKTAQDTFNEFFGDTETLAAENAGATPEVDDTELVED